MHGLWLQENQQGEMGTKHARCKRKQRKKGWKKNMSTTISAGNLNLPESIQLQRVLVVIYKWKAERNGKCAMCAKGLNLGQHGCHFEDTTDGEESYSVGNCKAWPLSRRIQQIE